ncbi:hypothetical protein COU74_04015 [Candidatus Peregrinibacteria bacterium CG10_big_fil_rev_8_21_14_0_10_36_19]|nr:MAG: hypothetical protein COU74_04015 [Candidatus Peregrinibacteria bacterium CG10_big_fil_rev_8_21_14_0_10_36_19]
MSNKGDKKTRITEPYVPQTEILPITNAPIPRPITPSAIVLTSETVANLTGDTTDRTRKIAELTGAVTDEMPVTPPRGTPSPELSATGFLAGLQPKATTNPKHQAFLASRHETPGKEQIQAADILADMWGEISDNDATRAARDKKENPQDTTNPKDRTSILKSYREFQNITKLQDLGLTLISLEIDKKTTFQEIEDIRNIDPGAYLIASTINVSNGNPILHFITEVQYSNTLNSASSVNKKVLSSINNGGNIFVKATEYGITLVDEKIGIISESFHTPTLSNKKTFMFAVELPEDLTTEQVIDFTEKATQAAFTKYKCHSKSIGNKILFFEQSERPTAITNTIQDITTLLKELNISAKMKLVHDDLKTNDLTHTTNIQGKALVKALHPATSAPNEIEISQAELVKFTTSRYWDSGINIAERKNADGDSYWILESLGKTTKIMKRGYVGREKEVKEIQRWLQNSEEGAVVTAVFVGAVLSPAGGGKTELLRQTLPENSIFIRPTTEDGTGRNKEELVQLGKRIGELSQTLNIENDDYFETLSADTCNTVEFKEKILENLRKISLKLREKDQKIGIVIDDIDGLTPDSLSVIVDLIPEIKSNPNFANIVFCLTCRNDVQYSEDMQRTDKKDNADSNASYVAINSLLNYHVRENQITLSLLRLGNEKTNLEYADWMGDFAVGHTVDILNLDLSEEKINAIKIKNPTLIGNIYFSKVGRKQAPSKPIIEIIADEYGDESLHQALNLADSAKITPAEFWDNFAQEYGTTKFIELVKKLIKAKKVGLSEIELYDVEEDLNIDLSSYKNQGLISFDIANARRIGMWESDQTILIDLAKKKYGDGDIVATPYDLAHVTHELVKLGIITYNKETNEIEVDYDAAMAAEITTEPEDQAAKQFERLNKREQKAILLGALLQGVKTANIEKLQSRITTLQTLESLKNRDIFEHGEKVSMPPRWRQFTTKYLAENPEMKIALSKEIAIALVAINTIVKTEPSKLFELLYEIAKTTNPLEDEEEYETILEQMVNISPLATFEALESSRYQDALKSAKIYFKCPPELKNYDLSSKEVEMHLATAQAHIFTSQFEEAKEQLSEANQKAITNREKQLLAELTLKYYDLYFKSLLLTRKPLRSVVFQEFTNYIEQATPILNTLPYGRALIAHYKAIANKDGKAAGLANTEVSFETAHQNALQAKNELDNVDHLGRKLSQTLITANTYLLALTLIEPLKIRFSGDYHTLIKAAASHSEPQINATLTEAEIYAKQSLRYATEFNIDDSETKARAAFTYAAAVIINGKDLNTIINALNSAQAYAGFAHPSIRTNIFIHLAILAGDYCKAKLDLDQKTRSTMIKTNYELNSYLYKLDPESPFNALNISESVTLNLAQMVENNENIDIIKSQIILSLATIKKNRQVCIENFPEEFVTIIAQHFAIVNSLDPQFAQSLQSEYKELITKEQLQEHKPKIPENTSTVSEKDIYYGTSTSPANSIPNLIRQGKKTQIEHFERII